jgi:hypothetical protein
MMKKKLTTKDTKNTKERQKKYFSYFLSFVLIFYFFSNLSPSAEMYFELQNSQVTSI